MRHLVKIFIASLFLYSCSNNNTQFVLKTDNAEGLSDNTLIYVNGLEVGRVNELSLAKDGSINLACELDSETQIPLDSKFTIEKTEIKKIEVQFGESDQYVKTGDTLMANTRGYDGLEDMINDKLGKFIDKLTSPHERK